VHVSELKKNASIITITAVFGRPRDERLTNCIFGLCASPYNFFAVFGQKIPFSHANIESTSIHLYSLTTGPPSRATLLCPDSTPNSLFLPVNMGSQAVAVRKCMGDDCDNDAGSLQCPTCLKLGVKDSYFCSQDCFKRNWVSAFC
jgi:hypothetical protein